MTMTIVKEDTRNRTFPVSRYRVHRLKTIYWFERMKLGPLNALIRELETTGKDPKQLNTLIQYRRVLMGNIRGMERAFKQLGIPIARHESPVVSDEDLEKQAKIEKGAPVRNTI